MVVEKPEYCKEEFLFNTSWSVGIFSQKKKVGTKFG